MGQRTKHQARNKFQRGKLAARGYSISIKQMLENILAKREGRKPRHRWDYSE